MNLTSDAYLQKCWDKVKSNELLKIHFANWFEMTTQLVDYATARWKEDMITTKAEHEEVLDYGDDEDEDSDAETQEGQLKKSRKRKSAEGDKTSAALAAIRTKRRRRSMGQFGKGNWDKQGWELDESLYLDRKENHNLNIWLNDTIHKNMKRSLISHKDMMDHYLVNTVFGNKMVTTVDAIRMKYSLNEQEVFGISYFVALPGAAKSAYVPRAQNCECVILHTFTNMDFILVIKGEEHFFKVAAKTALVFKTEMQLFKTANETEVQHRYVMVELAKKGSLTKV